MRRILVVSDSHGRDGNIQAAIDKAGRIDAMFHLGDVGMNYLYVEQMAHVPTYIVAGNCDYTGYLKYENIIKMGEHTIFATHGHRYSASVKLLRYRALELGCDIALFGHTHEPFLSEDENDVTIINPGSISLPRQSDRKKTFAILELMDDGGISCRFDSIN